MTIGDRIKKVRRDLDLTQQEFASRIGSVQNTITGYETGRRAPSSQVVTLICKTFNVSESWLRTGDGEPFVRRPEAEELSATVERLLTGESVEFKRWLINALSTLKDEQWLLLEQKLKEIVGAREAVPASAPSTLEQEADEYAAMAREQFLLEKRQESEASSAKGSGAG